MNGDIDPILLALTGHLPFIVISAALLSLPLSLVLLYRYRKVVRKYMEKYVGERNSPVANEVITSNKNQLEITMVSADSSQTSDDNVLYHQARKHLRNNLVIYILAGLGFTLAITVTRLAASNMEFIPMRFALLFWVQAWPIALTIMLAGAAGRRDIYKIAGGYFGVLILLTALAMVRNSQLTLLQAFLLWAFTNLPATLLFYASMARPIRAVGPIVLTLLLVAITGPVFFLLLAANSESLLRFISEITFSMDLGATETFAIIILTGLLIFTLLGSVIVNWIRLGYISKRLNDQSLLLDALWLLFAVFSAINIAFEGPIWTLSCVIAFIIYKTIIHYGFLYQSKASDKKPNTQLLLLRVFSLGKRSEILFDAVSKHWRQVGNVKLIAGPDLATTTVEPHEFLTFISGKIGRLFIGSQQELDSKIMESDNKPDFDGRFRIDDYFCFADTWKQVLSSLVRQSHVVLMDLRGFTPENAGCVHEIQELINVVPLRQILLVVDSSTDTVFLEKSLNESWSKMTANSPNMSTGSKQLTIMKLPHLNTQFLLPLLGQLGKAANKV